MGKCRDIGLKGFSQYLFRQLDLSLQIFTHKKEHHKNKVIFSTVHHFCISKTIKNWVKMNGKFRLLCHLKYTLLSYTEVILNLKTRGLGWRSCRRGKHVWWWKNHLILCWSLKIITVLVETGHISESLFKTNNMTQPNQKLLCFLTNLDYHVVFWALR